MKIDKYPLFEEEFWILYGLCNNKKEIYLHNSLKNNMPKTFAYKDIFVYMED